MAIFEDRTDVEASALLKMQLNDVEQKGLNRIPVIRGFTVRVTPISTSKIHAVNT
jgi:hypothetical protein